MRWLSAGSTGGNCRSASAESRTIRSTLLPSGRVVEGVDDLTGVVKTCLSLGELPKEFLVAVGGPGQLLPTHPNSQFRGAQGLGDGVVVLEHELERVRVLVLDAGPDRRHRTTTARNRASSAFGIR